MTSYQGPNIPSLGIGVRYEEPEVYIVNLDYTQVGKLCLAGHRCILQMGGALSILQSMTGV